MTSLAEYMTLNEQIEHLESQLMDAKIDLNMKDARIKDLEKQLRKAQFAIRELEIGTHTMRVLSLKEEEESFDPRETGTFKSPWERAR